jgi:hypothetical protein
MVALEDNNGDAVSCIVLMIDSLAKENQALVQLETLHQDDCNIFTMMDEKSVDNESINEHDATSEEARKHLYSCNCNVQIETTFMRGDGESLLVSFHLSEVKERHPWLNNPEETKEMIELHKMNEDAPLLESMKPVFKKQMGTPQHAWHVPSKESDTLH